MRLAAKVDDNQAAIVKALRLAGAAVQPLHTIGHGCPDLVVSYKGETFMVEVKAGPNDELTPMEEAWIAKWHAPVFVVRSPEAALKMLERV